MYVIERAIADGQPQHTLRLLRRRLKDRGLKPFEYTQLLHLAIAHHTAGDTALIHLLLKRGAVVIWEQDGHTPLMQAVVGGRNKTVSMLLTHGARLNIRNCHGQTSMHVAVQAHRAEMVEVLLRAGAAIHYRDDMNLTPAEYAFCEDRDELAQLIDQLAPNVGPDYLQEARCEGFLLLVFAYHRGYYLALDPNDIECPVIIGDPDCGWFRQTIEAAFSASGPCGIQPPYQWLIPWLERMQRLNTLNIEKLMQLAEQRCPKFRIVRWGDQWIEGW